MEKKARILFEDKNHRLVKYWWEDDEHKESDDYGVVYKGYTRFINWWICRVTYDGYGWDESQAKEDFLVSIS